MPITILDYVKSVVGDKDFYTAEDCLTSGVDILGGCQGCARHHRLLQRLPLHLRVLALRRLHRRGRIRHRRRLHRPRGRDRGLPVLREHRHHQRNPHHHRRTHRGIRAGMRRLRRGLAAMTSPPALDWLDAQFEQSRQRHQRRLPPRRPSTGNGMARSRCPADDRVPVRDGRRAPDAGHPRRLRRSRPVVAVKTHAAGLLRAARRRTRRHHWRRSRRPTASWPASTTRTPTPATRRPPPGSGRSPKPTTPCPTPTGDAVRPAPRHPDQAPRCTGPVHQLRHRTRAGTAAQQRLAGRQPVLKVLEDIWLDIRRRHPRNPPGRHHHRQRHRHPPAPLGPPRLRPLERRRRATRRSHDQRRSAPPHPRRGPGRHPARSRPRPGPRTRHQGHLPPGPLPQQALQDLRRRTRPHRRARPAQRLVRQQDHPRHRDTPTPASSTPWPRP